MSAAVTFPAGESANALNDLVRFPADAGGTPVECRVSLGTLSTVYHARSGLMLDAFREHRPAIEAVARRMILAGGVRDGVLTISSEDARPAPRPGGPATTLPDDGVSVVRRRLADGLIAGLGGGGAGYGWGHVDRCLNIVDAYLAKVGPGPTFTDAQITAALRKAVLELNALDGQCGGALTGADARKDLPRLLLAAAKRAGLKSDGDVTGAWREW